MKPVSNTIVVCWRNIPV